MADRLKAYKTLTGALSLNKAINRALDEALFWVTPTMKEKRT